MKAAVILVGDELLSGHTRDANAHFLAQRLTALGHKLRRVVVVPDESHAIAHALEFVIPRAQFVFISGGLGPTHDDRTSEALAERFHRRLVVDEPSWEHLVRRYGPRAEETEAIRDNARRMVTVPEGVECLENPMGAAPGYVMRIPEATIVVLPGVPAELQAIFEQRVVGHYLPERPAPTLVQVDLEMPEARFAHALSSVAQRFADVEIGSYPHFGERWVTLRFRGDEARAQAALEAFLDALPEARDHLKG